MTSLFFLSSHSQGGGSWLIDDAQTSRQYLAGVFRGVSLGVIEIPPDGDHCLGDGLAEEASASDLILDRIIAEISGRCNPCRPVSTHIAVRWPHRLHRDPAPRALNFRIVCPATHERLMENTCLQG